MDRDEFKIYAKYIMEEHKFQKLLSIPASEVPASNDYLKKRGVCTENIFYYNGEFNYRGRDYFLKNCVVVPLYGPSNDKILRGVWIRFIQEKRFYIWMMSHGPGSTKELQKYWINFDLDPYTGPCDSKIYVTESIFDAISLSNMLGTNRVVACLGAHPSADLMALLDKSGSQVILALDADRAGKINSLNLLTAKPSYGIMVASNKEKDFNDILLSGRKLDYQIMFGIRAKIHLRSTL